MLYGEDGAPLVFSHLSTVPGYFDDPDEPDLEVG